MAAKTAPEVMSSPILGHLFVSAAKWAAEVTEKAVRDSGQPIDLVAGQLHLLRATAKQFADYHGDGGG